MKRNLRSVITSTAVLVITGGVLAATALPATAAATPPFEPNSASLGSLTFYDAAGNAITGGNNLNHLFDYVKASTDDPDGGAKASVYFANPQVGQDPALWPTTQTGVSETFPNSSYPGSLGTTSMPVNKQTATQANLAAISGGFTPNTQAGYANVYQVRVYTSGGAGGGTTGPGTYWDDDIQVNPSTGSWYVTYAGGQVATGTSTTLTSAPSSTTAGNSATLTATETAFDGTNPAGSVQFTSGGTNVGSPVAVNASGVATKSVSFPTQGSVPLTAVFTPTDTSVATGYSGSTGTATETVGQHMVLTTTATVAANPTTATVGDPVTLTGTGTASDGSHPAGSIQFADGGANIGSPVAVNGNGVATFSDSSLAAGVHNITATYTPTDASSASPSNPSAPVTVTITAAAGACSDPTTGANTCSDDQTIQVTVPVGTLTISTPYTAACPFNLGTLTPDSSGGFLTTSKPFGDPNNLAPTTPSTASSTSTPPCAISGNGGITVTDLRSGGASWTASAQSTDFTHGADTISGYNLGLTGLQAVHPAGSTAVVNVHNQPPASPVEGPAGTGPGGIKDKVAIADTTGSGFGTTFIDGTLQLNAPTATPAGTYDATVTFSVM